MASKEELRQQEHKQQFTEEQLRAVDNAYNATTDSVDLAEAVRIGLITDETKQQIETSLGIDHARLLRSARDRILAERGAGADRAKALRAAFEQVYGKFLLEEEYKALPGTDPRKQLSNDFDEKLKDVLKVEIHERLGITGRSELVAAREKLMRLQTAGVADAKDVLSEAFTISLPLEQAEIDTRFAEAESKLTSITTVPANIQADVGKIKSLVVLPINRKNLEEAITLLINIQGFFDENERKKITAIIDNLEQITEIKAEVAIERATTRKKQAEAKVKKAENVREYFETNKTPKKIEGAMKSLMDETGAKTVTNADGQSIPCVDLSIKDTLVELGSIIVTQGKLENLVEPANQIIQTIPSVPVAPATPQQPQGLSASEQRKEAGKKKSAAEKDKTTLEGLNKKAKELYDLLSTFTENTTFLAKNNFLHKSYDPSKIEKLNEEIRGMNPETSSVSIKTLKEKYDKLENDGWFKIFGFNLNDIFSGKMAEYNKGVRDADDNLKKKNEALKAVKDLSDTEAAKKIILAVVKRQHPDMELADQHKLVDMILAEDVEKIQTSKDYATLAKEGSENLEALVKTADKTDFRWKILRFKYQEGGKVIQPFKDLKPEDLDMWEKVEKWLDTGKFDYKAGGVFLAAMAEHFPGEKGMFTIVYRKLEKKLKQMIAEKLGVSKRMGESYVRKVVEEAFNTQLEKSRGLMKAHFEHYGKNKKEINLAKIRELEHRLKELDEKRRLKKIDQEVYEEKCGKIKKEAEEYGIETEIGFPQDVVMSGYLNSPEAQWLKDLGVDIGRYGGKKALAIAKGTALTGAHGMFGAVKLGASFGFQAAMTPLRAVKYPLLALAKPFAWAANLVLANKLTVPKITDTLRADAGRVVGYFGKKGAETVAGAKAKATAAYGEPWKAAKFERVGYDKRTEVKLDEEAARIAELAGKAELTPLEIAESPSIDFEALRKKIAAADEKFEGKSRVGDAKNHPALSGEVPAKKPEESTGHGQSKAA